MNVQKMKVNVYQMKDEDKYHGRKFRELPEGVNEIELGDYDQVWNGELRVLPAETDDNHALEYLYHKLNAGDKPPGYKGHSLSVSDVISLDGRFYACQSAGWKQVTIKVIPVQLEVGQVFNIHGVATCLFDTLDRSSTYGYNGKLVALEIDKSQLDENTYWCRPFELRSGDPGKVVVMIPLPDFVKLALENGYQIVVEKGARAC